VSMKPARSQCGNCHEVFNGVPAFDEHRTGSFAHRTRRCLSVQEIQAKGMTRDEKGQWTLLEMQEAPWYKAPPSVERAS